MCKVQKFAELMYSTYKITDLRNIKKSLLKYKEKVGAEKFIQSSIPMFCGRSFNEFFDYGLFLLKLQHIYKGVFNSIDTPIYNEEGVYKLVDEATYLLFDDRHDYYQNYDFMSMSQEKLDDVAIAFIECINTAGTGDISYKTTLL
jgi:hypothetical protein